ncbi:hypothetical protein PO909_008017 [Leuciscus waleckii]
MSLSSQKTTSQAIPTTRRVIINDAAHMPHDYSTTPGGTLFSTTPGGVSGCCCNALISITSLSVCSSRMFVCVSVFYLITKLYIGTRIIYDRKFLLECRSSPLARTPPCCLPDIPGVTSPPSVTIKNDKAHPKQTVNNNNISPLADKSAGKSNFQTCPEAKSY